MAKYRSITTRFWTDNFISELNPLDRYLFLYFLTNEHTNIIGIYEVPLRVISFETGIEIDMLKKMLDRLDGKIFYVDGWVFIKNFVKYQSENPSVKKGQEVALNEVPQKILNKINEIEQSMTACHSLSQDPSNIYSTVQDSTVQDRILMSSDLPKKEVGTKAIVKRMKIKYPDEFEKFWDVCPNQKGKPVAFESFSKIDPELYPTIIEAMKTQAASGIWKEERFTPMPSTWLNQIRWEDKVLKSNIDPMESEARALLKQFPADNDTTAQFRFRKKYGNENLLRFKHLFNL